MILIGVGIASGEYILFPFIASQAGLVFLWAAVVGIVMQFFINMEIERYTLATGETAIGGFMRMWKGWGACSRSAPSSRRCGRAGRPRPPRSPPSPSAAAIPT